MSALRIPGPDGHTILQVIDDGAVGRISFSRSGIKGGSGTVVYRPGVSAKTLDRVMKNPDNGAVEASTTEVQT